MWQALLCSERLQSSPRRILDWPSDPVCSMLKARAIIGSWCGKSKSLLVRSCKVRGTVSDFSHSWALKGPAMRPCWTSVAISFAIMSQCGSVWLCWTFLRMYCLLWIRRSQAMGSVYSGQSAHAIGSWAQVSQESEALAEFCVKLVKMWALDGV